VTAVLPDAALAGWTVSGSEGFYYFATSASHLGVFQIGTDPVDLLTFPLPLLAIERTVASQTNSHIGSHSRHHQPPKKRKMASHSRHNMVVEEEEEKERAQQSYMERGVPVTSGRSRAGIHSQLSPICSEPTIINSIWQLSDLKNYSPHFS
jgi:hypothetical protein